MTFDPLDEARLADAWVTPDGVARERAPCPAPDRFWDVAQGAVDVGAMHALLDHTASCAECALALRTAVEVHAASGLPTPRRGRSLWTWLGATALRPEAALAYLLLLTIGFPVFRWLQPPAVRPDTTVAVVRGVRVIGLESGTVSRGGEAAKPAVVDAAGEDAIVLRLFLDREDLVAGAPLGVTLSIGDRVLAAPKLNAGLVGENGTLEVTLDARSIPRDLPLVLVVTSGSDRVFERSFVVRGR